MIDGSLAWTAVRAVISLALVLALLVWCMRILARRGGYTPSRRIAPVEVDIIGRRQLARGASVQVVRVGGRTLVLGVTEEHVRVLTHLSAGDLRADEEPDASSPDATTPTPAPSVAQALRRQGQIGRFVADAARRNHGGRHRGGSRV